MAVKVMVAPVIAKGELAKPVARRIPAKAAPAARARRRRSSVYDADGNEVFITLVCLKCQKIRPLSQFGLRRMADGAIRNQPWCKLCRSAPAPREQKGDKARRSGSLAAGESPIPGGPLASPSVVAPPASPSVVAPKAEDARPRSVAAEVAAALAAGRG